MIIVGHTRWLAAKALELKEVPVIYATHLTPKQVKAYRIADNKTSQFSVWDMDLLPDELKVLDDLYTGFDDDELEKLLSVSEFEPGSEDDQGNLDELEPKYISCPHCGKEFDMRENK